MKIQKELISLQDKEYAQFQSNLIPGISKDTIIGVRVPEIRKLAKKYLKSSEYKDFLEDFLNELPHKYYDENMLHGILISGVEDYGKCIELVDKFLPYVDNWATCDTMSPKIFKKNRENLIKKIKEWTKSKKIYTCRFGLGMLMEHFLDNDFKKEYLEILANIHSEEYYVNMMAAWFFATALAKQWDSTIPYLENGSLTAWVHNKTIQKARESRRITSEQKEHLKTLKR